MTSHLLQIFCCFCVLKSCHNVIFQPLFCCRVFWFDFVFLFFKKFFDSFFSFNFILIDYSGEDLT